MSFPRQTASSRLCSAAATAVASGSNVNWIGFALLCRKRPSPAKRPDLALRLKDEILPIRRPRAAALIRSCSAILESADAAFDPFAETSQIVRSPTTTLVPLCEISSVSTCTPRSVRRDCQSGNEVLHRRNLADICPIRVREIDVCPLPKRQLFPIRRPSRNMTRRISQPPRRITQHRQAPQRSRRRIASAIHHQK